MNSASYCQMGAPQSSEYEAIDYAAAPASFPAGTAVRLKSDGTISKTLADGAWVGISRGRSLSSTNKLSVICSGRGVPVLVSRQPARGIITITSYANLVAVTPDTIKVGATVFTAQSGAATPGDATFRAATSNDATATSLAAQINAHATAGALVMATAVAAVVTVTAILNDTSADAIALEYADLGTDTVGATVSGATLTESDSTPDYMTLGSKVYFSDVTGLADDPNSDSTISDAVYASGLLTGYDEDGAEVLAVLVDFQGGL